MPKEGKTTGIKQADLSKKNPRTNRVREGAGDFIVWVIFPEHFDNKVLFMFPAYGSFCYPATSVNSEGEL